MKWIMEASHRADLLLLAGDLLDHGQGREEVSWWLRAMACPFALATGNHDVMFGGPYWLHGLRSPTRLIDEAGPIAGIPVAALPWECENGDWHENATQMCKTAASGRRPWIMLAHSVTPTGPTREAALFEDSVSARLCYTGHSHRAGCFAGWVNCGQTGFDIPNHMWIDWETGLCTLCVRHEGNMKQLTHSLTK